MQNILTNPTIKTITFEARPMWETAIHAKKFSGSTSADAVRKENYVKVKEILDNYTRYVINMATQMLVSENLEPTFENLNVLYLKSRDSKSKDDIKRYEKAVKDFKNHVVEVIKKYSTEKQLIKAQGDLFNEKKSCLLNDATAFKLTAEEKELIRLYNGFTGYFSKYFDSLSKTILCGTEYGSISNRIVENMERFFQNKKILEEIQEKYPDLYEKLSFNIKKMTILSCLWQEGIDSYNAVLGDTSNTGINSIINEFRQREKIRVNGLKPLNKIPYAKKKKQIIMQSIDNEEELSLVICESISLVESLIAYAKKHYKNKFRKRR